MKTKSIKYIGLGLVVLVILVIGWFVSSNLGKPSKVEINGYVGGEKIGTLEDPEIAKILEDNYGLTINYLKAGSYEMIHANQENMNYLFPASQGAFTDFKKLTGTTPKNQIVFNTPVVLYSRTMVVDALRKVGIVTVENDVHFVDMKKLAEVMVDGTTWADLGATQLYGSVLVETTDPNSSNSGNMFLGLLANSINNGQVVQKSTVDKVLPDLKIIYDKLGYMESSSADMFSQFIRTGVGANPIIAGYENQLLEFAVDNPTIWQNAKNDIIILYPKPTVWSNHIYISLNEAGDRGIEGLMDPKVQELAWKKHGFRTGLNTEDDIKAFDIKGIPNDITQVTQMPDTDTMNLLLKGIQ